MKMAKMTRHGKKHSLDWFVRKKTSEILDEKWNLKEATIRMKNTRKRFDRTKTMNLVEKMKIYFRDNYTSSFEYFDGTKAAAKEDVRRKKELKAALKETDDDFNDIKMTNSIEVQSSVDEDDVQKEIVHATESIYLKKLKNNYYDRKLWKSLSSSKEFNFVVDNHVRDYSSDFNILKAPKLKRMLFCIF
jgi:hypothetical protein